MFISNFQNLKALLTNTSLQDVFFKHSNFSVCAQHVRAVDHKKKAFSVSNPSPVSGLNSAHTTVLCHTHILACHH